MRRHDKRKSRSLNELEAEFARQESELCSQDKMGRSKSEPTKQRKPLDATTIAVEKDIDKKKKGKVKMLAQNYSRMLHHKVRKTQSVQPEATANKQRGDFSRLRTRQSVSAQSSPGTGRRLAEFGIRTTEEESAQVRAGSADGVGVVVTMRDVRERLREPSRRASVPLYHVAVDETSDSGSICSEASGGNTLDDIADDDRGKDRPPVRGWVKKLAARFQGK